MGSVRSEAERWLAAEPDDDVRDELIGLLAGPSEILAERFSGGLEFGTAGLRAAIGAGPRRMNRLVVRRAAAGLADHLVAEGTANRGVLVGFDARRKSREFAVDTVRVLAARGVPAWLVTEPVPTPVIAWATPEFGASAAVVVTASHNPPSDNGYKVYLGDGSQVVPPIDAAIAAAIDRIDACGVELAAVDHPLVRRVGPELVDRYVEWAAGRRLIADAPIDLRVAHTSLHGVGGDVVRRVLTSAGAPEPMVVREQHEPDGSFPTVSFPNPEEPGAMDLLLELARSTDAHLALASDPDADRLGVAIPDRDSWRRLTGDEIGWLLADHVLRNTSGDDRLVVTTLVSSSMLGKMAERHGVDFAECSTGFKWIADAARRRPGRRLVFAYEQALGYLVGDRPLDKDGITAALAMVELAASLRAAGSSIARRLEELAREYGRHRTAEVSVRRVDGRSAVDSLAASPPSALAGEPVVAVEVRPEAGLVRLWVGSVGDGVRVQIRPSGTEPKVKIYGEAVDRDPAPFVEATASLIGSSTVRSGSDHSARPTG